MKFALHTTIRWEDGPDSERAYYLAVAAYYRHLSRLNLVGAAALLRYFGDSFFHDAEVTGAHFDLRAAAIELKLFRGNDLEDINEHRRRKQLSPVTPARYRKRPVLYVCRFRGVTSIRGDVARFRDRRLSISIMDTEIDRPSRRGEFLVRMSTGRHSGLEFSCHRCSVEVQNANWIRAYSGGSCLRFPRCGVCRSKLLNRRRVLQIMRDAEARSRAIEK